MEKFVVGEIVVAPFPFSDLTSSIRRPVLVVANLEGDDLIVCQITTKERENLSQTNISQNDLVKGNLNKDSFVRTGKILTIKNSRILYKIGKLKKEKIGEIIHDIIEIFKKGLN